MMSSVKVAVRVRPINKREKALNSDVVVKVSGNAVFVTTNKFLDSSLSGSISSKDRHKQFTFDHSYSSVDSGADEYADQEKIYKDLGTSVVSSCIEGYNACIFAYGQTGSGKSYTMMGGDLSCRDSGILTPIKPSVNSKDNGFNVQITSHALSLSKSNCSLSVSGKSDECNISNGDTSKFTSVKVVPSNSQLSINDLKLTIDDDNVKQSGSFNDKDMENVMESQTILNGNKLTLSDRGLTPRVCENIIKKMNSTDCTYKLQVSYMEIYNERVRDLLKNNNGLNLKVREHPKEGPYVQNLSRHTVTSYSDIQQLLNIGNKHRTTASTLMNQQSSRSHALFTLYLNQAKLSEDLPSELSSKVHLVDLAGSERAESSGCQGERLKEGGSINKSLVTLGGVICALAEQSSSRFIPYRNSTLTWVLKDSLGGNSLTLMIATISPAEVCLSETMSTLRYASRSKKIINTPHVNQDANVKLIRELKEENAKLKQLLATAQESLSPQVLETTHKLYDNEHKVQELLEAWTQKWQHIFCEIKQDKETSRNTKTPLLVCLLDCVNPLNSVRMYPINQGDTVIGSETDECKPDITLPGLDSPHCVISLQDDIGTLKTYSGSLCLIDSAVPESSQALIHHGSMIQLGGRYLLRFNMPRDAIMSSRATNSSMNDSAIDVCASLKNSMEGSRNLNELSRSFGDILYANSTIENYLESSRSLSDVLGPTLKVPTIETSRSVGSCMDASRYVNNGVQVSNNEMDYVDGLRTTNNTVKVSGDMLNHLNKKHVDCFNISLNNINNNKKNAKLTRRSNSVGDMEEDTISERQLEMLKLERERQLEGWIELMKESDYESKYKETEKAWFKKEIDNLKRFVHKNMLLLHSNLHLNDQDDDEDDIGYDNDLGGFKNSNKSIYDAINLGAYDYSLSGLCLHCDDNECTACNNNIDKIDNSLRGCFSSASLSSPRYVMDGWKARKMSRSRLNLGSLDRMNMKKNKNKFINQSMSSCARSLFSDCSEEQPMNDKPKEADAIYIPNDEDLARVDIKELSSRLADGMEFIESNVNTNNNNKINKQIALLETRINNVISLLNYLLKKVSCFHAISTALKAVLKACGTLKPPSLHDGDRKFGTSTGMEVNPTTYDRDNINSIDANFIEFTSCDVNGKSHNGDEYYGCYDDDASKCVIDDDIGGSVSEGSIQDNNNNALSNDTCILMTTVLRMLQEKMVEVKVRRHMIYQILTSKDPIMDFQPIVIRCKNTTNNNSSIDKKIDSVDNDEPKNIVFCSSFHDDVDMVTTESHQDVCKASVNTTAQKDNNTINEIVDNTSIQNDNNNESVYKRLEDVERQCRLSDELIKYIQVHIKVQQYIKMHKQQNSVPKEGQNDDDHKNQKQQQPSNQLLTAATIKYNLLAESAAEAKLLLTGTDKNELALSLRTETCILREMITFDLNDHWCNLIRWKFDRPIVSQAPHTASISLDVTNALNQSTLFIDVCSALHCLNSLDQHLTSFSSKLMDLLHKGIDGGFTFKNNIILVNNNNNDNNNNNVNPLDLIAELEKLMRLIWCVFNLELSSSSSSFSQYSMVGKIGETVVPKLFEMLCHHSFVPYIHRIHSSIHPSFYSCVNQSTNLSSTSSANSFDHSLSFPQCTFKSIKNTLSANPSPWTDSYNLFETCIHFQTMLQSLSFIHSTHPSILSSIHQSICTVTNSRHKMYLKCFNETIDFHNTNNKQINKNNSKDNNNTKKHCIIITENHPLGFYGEDLNDNKKTISINGINNNNRHIDESDTNNINVNFNNDNNNINIDNSNTNSNKKNNIDDIERYVLDHGVAGPHSLISCEASKLVALLYVILQETISCCSFTAGDSSDNLLASLLFKCLAVVAAKCCNYIVYKDDGGDDLGKKNSNVENDCTYSNDEEDNNFVSEDDEDEEENDDDDVKLKRKFKDIKSDLMTPFEAALHFNDCKFLSRHLKRICYLFNNNNKTTTYKKTLNNVTSKASTSSNIKSPTSSTSTLATTQALTIVKGSLSLLRHKSASPLQYTIKLHIQAAIATLSLADWTGISDNNGAACFRVVTQFFRFINKEIVGNWKGVLSDKIYQKSLGVIITCWMEDWMERLLRVAEFSQDDCLVLCEVLDVVVRNVPEFFKSPGLSEARLHLLTIENIKSWLKFKETRSLFGSNLTEISDRWASGLGPLALHFSANQVAQMIRAIFENTNKRESVVKGLLRHPSIHHP